MKHKKKPVIIVSICLAVAIAAFCLWFFWLKDLVTLSGATPVYVNSVSTIVGLDTGTNPRYSGIVEPQKTYKINKDESKTVAEILIAEGDEVHVGDPLFRYDTEEMQLSLSQAELELEGIANQISTLKSQKSTLESEKKKASDDDQYSYTVQIQSVELQIKTAEYNSSVKKSEIDKLKNSLENAEVLSEVEGVVKEVNITPKTDATGQQLPFISILSSGEFRVKGTVTEMNRGSLAAGQAVVVHSRVNPDITWSGTVESVDSEPISNANNGNVYYSGSGDSSAKSSKYNFYVTLQSLDGLILGQHVYIEPDLGESAQKTGLWLPAFYGAHDENGSFVWARSGKDKLEKRTVILGDYDTENDMYEIESGINEQDFIAFPDETLKEGLPTTTDSSVSLPGTDENGGTDGVPGGMDAGGMDGGAAIPQEEGGGMDMPSEEGAQSVLGEDGTADGENFPADGANTEGLEG